MVTQADLSKLDITDVLDATTVADIMTPRPVAVAPYDTLDDILFLFSQHKYTWLPVTDHDKFKGIILQSDVLKALFTFESSGDEAHPTEKQATDSSQRRSEGSAS